MIDRQKIIDIFKNYIKDEETCINLEKIVYDNFHNENRYNKNIIQDIYYNKIYNIIRNKKVLNLINKNNNKINKITDINIYHNWKKVKVESDLITNNILIQNNEMANGVFYCSKCKRDTKCFYTTAQTRSADEGLTSFITCGHCGHNWKET